jgi:hypothetical protein
MQSLPTTYNFIEGQVKLKRKKQWVKRWATVENNTFSYKGSNTDKKVKTTIDLRTAKVMLGQSENSAPYIYICKDPFKPEAIRIAFDNAETFNLWLEVVQKGRKTEQEILDQMKSAENA